MKWIDTSVLIIIIMIPVLAVVSYVQLRNAAQIWKIRILTFLN